MNQISNSKKDNNNKNNNNNNNNNPRVMRFIGGGGYDEKYITTQRELDQAQEEYQRPTEEPFTRLWEGALMTPTKEIGQDLYKGAHIVHTIVEVYDGKKHVFIESVKDPLNGHNIVYIFDEKDLDKKQYYPVESSIGSLKNLTVDELCNKIEEDYGIYELCKNDCVTVSEEVLRHAGNNNGVNIIEDMKSEYGKIRKKMIDYYKDHPDRLPEILPYLRYL